MNLQQRQAGTPIRGGFRRNGGGMAMAGLATSGRLVPHLQDLYTDERKVVPYAKVAFVGWVVVIAVGLLIAQIDSHPLRAYVDAVRSDSQSNDVANPPRLYLPVGGYLNGVLQIPVYVGIFIWQFRAAKTARDLRLWAEHSPALGTWSWIIPIVNFWFPYQAIRDCLPGDDPGRASVAWMWVFFIGMTVSNLAAIALIFAGSSAGSGHGSGRTWVWDRVRYHGGQISDSDLRGTPSVGSRSVIHVGDASGYASATCRTDDGSISEPFREHWPALTNRPMDDVRGDAP